MYLHVVGFGPKCCYGIASWDDDVNCYVRLESFLNWFMCQTHFQYLYTVRNLKHAWLLTSVSRWEKRCMDDEVAKDSIVYITHSLVFWKMLKAALECMQCIHCLNLELKNFVFPEHSCYPNWVYSSTLESTIFHLWLALLSRNRRRKGFERVLFVRNYQKQHTHCSLTL